ncbi:MAG: TlpA disulfide reductase family protein, partial [Myxococcota bacterium]
MNINRLLAASMTALMITAGSSSARASNPQSASQPAPRTPSQANQSGTVPASTHPVRMPPEAPLSIHEGAVPVGKPAPSFRIRALDGAMVRLDELAYPGRNKRYAPKRPVFVDFFRTDCQPCIKALPQLIQMHKEHAGNGLKVLMVALLEQDRGEEKLEAFLAQHPVPFTVVKDLSDHVAEKFMG